MTVVLELLRRQLQGRAELRSDSVLPEEQAYDTLRLSVTDTGAGISEVSYDVLFLLDYVDLTA